MSDLSAFHGPNAGYVLDLYDRYLDDPSSVDPDTRATFEHVDPEEIEALAAARPRSGAPPVASSAPLLWRRRFATTVISTSSSIPSVRRRTVHRSSIPPFTVLPMHSSPRCRSNQFPGRRVQM